MGGFPGGEAAGDFGYAAETGALEEAGGDGGAVAAGAVDEYVTVAWHVCRFLDEMIFGVPDFHAYLDRCGGLPRLQQLRQQEFQLATTS